MQFFSILLVLHSLRVPPSLSLPLSLSLSGLFPLSGFFRKPTLWIEVPWEAAEGKASCSIVRLSEGKHNTLLLQIDLKRVTMNYLSAGRPPARLPVVAADNIGEGRRRNQEIGGPVLLRDPANIFRDNLSDTLASRHCLNP